MLSVLLSLLMLSCSAEVAHAGDGHGSGNVTMSSLQQDGQMTHDTTGLQE